MFAVVKTGGKQYKVAQGDTLEVEKLEGQTGDTVTLDQVLMLGKDEGTQIGAPLVDGAKVTGEIVQQKKGPKIIVFKKRRRKNYRRKNGHRQELTCLKITQIEG